MNELRIRNDYDVSSELSAFFFRTMVDTNRDLRIGVIGMGAWEWVTERKLTSDANFLYSACQLCNTLKGHTIRKGLKFPRSRR